MVKKDTRSEKEKNHDAKMDAARGLLLGGGGPKTPTRQIIGKKAAKATRTGNIYATGYHSDALGVNPEQISEATAALRANGVMNDFDPETGACIITSPNDHKKVARATGMYSGRDGFDIKNDDGNSDLTGRAKVTERRRSKERFLRELEEY